MEEQEKTLEIPAGTMKKCPDCGKMISARATSCPNCGAPLQTSIRKCPDCGKDVSIYAAGCPGCGRPLEPEVRTDLKPVNMGFSMVALPIIIVLCSWASVLDFSFWSGTSLFVFIFAVFIGIEIYRNRKIKEIGHPAFWALGALFFYPLVYPLYVFKRKELRLDSIFKWLSIPLAILTLYCWIESCSRPRLHIGADSLSSSPSFEYSAPSSSSSFGSAASRDEVICRKARESMTEWLASMQGSKAPSCTEVTILKKVSSSKWIGKATTSNGRSGEISIDAMGLGDDDPDPVVMVIPVDVTDFYNPFE